jgi:hypothetical protein
MVQKDRKSTVDGMEWRVKYPKTKFETQRLGCRTRVAAFATRSGGARESIDRQGAIGVDVSYDQPAGLARVAARPPRVEDLVGRATGQRKMAAHRKPLRRR